MPQNALQTNAVLGVLAARAPKIPEVHPRLKLGIRASQLFGEFVRDAFVTRVSEKQDVRGFFSLELWSIDKGVTS